MMGFGQTADIVQASATFARMCDETGSVNACRAVDGYLSSAWMQERRRKERGAAKPIRREPPRAALAELGLRGRSTGIVGFCLGADGRCGRPGRCSRGATRGSMRSSRRPSWPGSTPATPRPTSRAGLRSSI